MVVCTLLSRDKDSMAKSRILKRSKTTFTSDKIYCANCIHCKLFRSPRGREPVRAARAVRRGQVAQEARRGEGLQVFHRGPAHPRGVRRLRPDGRSRALPERASETSPSRTSSTRPRKTTTHEDRPSSCLPFWGDPSAIYRHIPAGRGRPGPLTPKPLFYGLGPPSERRPPIQPKALQFHDLRTLQRTRNRAALATPVGPKGDLRLQERRSQAEILRAGDVPLPLRRVSSARLPMSKVFGGDQLTRDTDWM